MSKSHKQELEDALINGILTGIFGMSAVMIILSYIYN